MKKRWLFAVLSLLGVLALLAGCTVPEAKEPVKLPTPTVTLEGDTVSWEPIEGADKLEISIDGELSYLENTVTSKKLSDGQSFKLRAVGDGIDYKTGEWSNVVTYVADSTGGGNDTPGGGGDTPGGGNDTPGGGGDTPGGGNDTPGGGNDTPGGGNDNPNEGTEEPRYLGIFVSAQEPNAQGGLPEGISHAPTLASYMDGAYYPPDNAIKEYFGNVDNYLGSAYPPQSQYDIYSTAGATVYVQIWLDNPDQHTILSLKLNGAKYQVGGGLSSFFIVDEGVYYNCVYVALTIPSDSHTEAEYVVTDIEYIADTYVNADGTDSFMNDNDTVTVGLPYSAAMPEVGELSLGDPSVNGVRADFTLSDGAGYVTLTGGWLGATVYDGERVIANRAVSVGENSLTFEGLTEGSYYSVIVYLFADTHDGRGVSLHVLEQRGFSTEEAITVDKCEDVLLYDEESGGYRGAVSISTTLNSATAEYLGFELIDEEGQAVYTDTEYTGSALVSHGIFNGKSYTVRVYYKDNEYPEGRCREEHVWVRFLGESWFDGEMYNLYKDSVYVFSIDNNDGNYPAVKGFTARLYNESSPRWIAPLVLRLIDDPDLLTELEGQIAELEELMYGLPHHSAEQMEVMDRLEVLRSDKYALESAKEKVEYDYGSNWDRAYWQEYADAGRYFYEIAYDGNDTDTVFRVGNKFYLVLEDLFDIGFDRCRFELDYTVDRNEGGEYTEKHAGNTIYLHNEFNYFNGTEAYGMSVSGSELTLSLRNYEGDAYRKSYVYKIVVYDEHWQPITLYTAAEPDALNIDEDAWLADYIAAVRSGEDTEGIFGKHVPLYADSYTLPIELSLIPAGRYSIDVITRRYAEDYGPDEEGDSCRGEVEIYKQISAPTVSFEGRIGTVLCSDANLWNWESGFEFMAEDANGNSVSVLSPDGYEDGSVSDRFLFTHVGGRVKVKINENGYWYASEWSEWIEFKGENIPTPELYYNEELGEITWAAVEGTVSYAYTVNGGEVHTVNASGERSVIIGYGDELSLWAVVSNESYAQGYVNSIPATYVSADERSLLAVPGGVSSTNGSLRWDEVAGAEYYIVSYEYNGITRRKTVYGTTTTLPAGAVARVRAYSAGNTRGSDWSASVTVARVDGKE